MRELLVNRLRGAATVMAFEWSRSFTFARVGVWVMLAIFPLAIVTLLGIAIRKDPNDTFLFDLVLFYLIPQVVCLLGLLLWATPTVHAELEGRTWVYLAVRPDGKAMVMLGKYFAAVSWTAAACLTGLTLSVASGAALDRMAEPLGSWLVVAAIILLATLSYGSLFTLMGVMFHRRAMVVAVAYTVASEFVMANVPAVINKITITHHLRSLLGAWRNWPGVKRDQDFLDYFSGNPPIQHLAMLLIITVGCLIASVLIVRRREYITAEES